MVHGGRGEDFFFFLRRKEHSVVAVLSFFISEIEPLQQGNGSAAMTSPKSNVLRKNKGCTYRRGLFNAAYDFTCHVMPALTHCKQDTPYL